MSGLDEIDQVAFVATAKWCVYLHSRPDGSVFYVGKGLRRRAFDFAPSRRTLHHKNIVQKHGRVNIGVKVIPCASEQEAFWLERAHIKMRKSQGTALVNLTDGGEGASGRPVTAKQIENLKLGRGKLAYARLSESAKASIAEGSARGRVKRHAWGKTPEGQEHIRMLAALGREVLHRERHLDCAQCDQPFKTRCAKARFCSRLCEQRNRRARRAA